jgi:predicted transcriptional regulator
MQNRTLTFRCSEETREEIENLAISTKTPPTALARMMIEAFLALPEKELLRILKGAAVIRGIMGAMAQDIVNLTKRLDGLQEYREAMEQSIEASKGLEGIIKKRATEKKEEVLTKAN